MNTQIRYGLVSLLLAVLLFFVAKVGTDPETGTATNLGEAAMGAMVLCLLAGVVLLIVGLVRKRPVA